MQFINPKIPFLNNFTKTIISLKLLNVFDQEFEKLKNNFLNQYEIINLPKNFSEIDILENLFIYGKLIFSRIEELDEFNFFPFVSNSYLSKFTNWKNRGIISPIQKSNQYKPEIPNFDELKLMPFIFIFKSQKSPIELIFSDLKQLSYDKLAQQTNRYNSTGQKLIFGRNSEKDIINLRSQIDVENLDAIQFISEASAKKNNNLQIGGRTYQEKVVNSIDNTNSISFEIDKIERRIEELLGIMSSNFSEKSSAQESDSQLLSYYSKTINNGKAIIKNINQNFKNIAKFDARFLKTQMRFSPFVEKKINSFESILEQKIQGEENGQTNNSVI